MNTNTGVDSGRHCILAHSLNNKLAAIVGYCDLMADGEEDPVCAKRLAEVRTIALAMGKAINGHDCRMANADAGPASPVWPSCNLPVLSTLP
jgi:hypothetical protein